MQNPMSRFGENLRALRTRAKLNQGELGKRLGLTHQSTISLWETGKIKLPDVDMMRKIADVLHCQPADLLVGVVTPLDMLRGSTLPLSDRPSDVQLTDAEIELIRLWRRMSPASQQHLRGVIELLAHRRRRPPRESA
jgi:transcriptional regulator with XRE-family HTH domain